MAGRGGREGLGPLRGGGRRLVGRALLLAVGFALAVAFAPPAGAQEYEGESDGEIAPEVGVWFQAAGGDAVDVHFHGENALIEGFAADVATALGAPLGADVDVDLWDSTLASVQLEGRLLERSGDTLAWSLDWSGLLAVADRYGSERIDLYVCVPTVRRTLDWSRPPDLADWFGPRGGGGYECPAWHVSPTAAPLRFTVTLRPDGARYARTLVIPMALTAVALGLLAAGLAVVLRRSVLTSLDGSALGVALGAAAVAVAVVPVAALFLGHYRGPAVELVFARDLSVPQQFAVTVLPAFLAALPFLAFAVVVLRAPAPPFQPAPPAPPPSPYGPGLPPWLAARRPAPAPAGPPPVRVASPGPRPAPSGGSDWPLEPPP